MSIIRVDETVAPSEDQVPKHIIDFMAMPKAAQFEKIAMNIENPQIFGQFIALESDAPVWDYAYAAGIFSKADRDFVKEMNEASQSEEDTGSTNSDSPTPLEHIGDLSGDGQTL